MDIVSFHTYGSLTFMAVFEIAISLPRSGSRSSIPKTGVEVSEPQVHRNGKD
jgi:hypothetical protein